MHRLANTIFLSGSLRLSLSKSMRLICFTVFSVHKDCFYF